MRSIVEALGCVLAVLVCLPREGGTSGVLNIRITGFSNPRGRTYDGSCCDNTSRDTYSTCLDQCDYVMRLIVSGLGRANDHVFLFHRPLKYDSNNIAFEAGDSNMVLSVLFDRWPLDDHVKMNAFFYDYDDLDHTTTLVDWFETDLRHVAEVTMSGGPIQNSQFQPETVLGNREKDKTLLTFEWAAMCHESAECSLFYPTQHYGGDSSSVTYNTETPSGSSLVLAAHTSPSFDNSITNFPSAEDLAHPDIVTRQELLLQDGVFSTEDSVLHLSTEMHSTWPYLDSREVGMVMKNRETSNQDRKMEHDNWTGHKTNLVTADVISTRSHFGSDDKLSKLEDYHDLKSFKDDEKYVHLHFVQKKPFMKTFTQNRKELPKNPGRITKQSDLSEDSSIISNIESGRQTTKQYDNLLKYTPGIPETTNNIQSDVPYSVKSHDSYSHNDHYTTSHNRQSQPPHGLGTAHTLGNEYLEDPRLLSDLEALLTQENPVLPKTTQGLGLVRQKNKDSVYSKPANEQRFKKETIFNNHISWSPESYDDQLSADSGKEQQSDLEIVEPSTDVGVPGDLALKTQPDLVKPEAKLFTLSSSSNKNTRTPIATKLAANTSPQTVKGTTDAISRKGLPAGFTFKASDVLETEIPTKEQMPSEVSTYLKIAGFIGKSRQNLEDKSMSSGVSRNLHQTQPQPDSNPESNWRPTTSHNVNTLDTTLSALVSNVDDSSQHTDNSHSTFEVNEKRTHKGSKRFKVKYSDKPHVFTSSRPLDETMQNTDSFGWGDFGDETQSVDSALHKTTNSEKVFTDQASTSNYPHPNLISTAAIVRNSTFTLKDTSAFSKRLKQYFSNIVSKQTAVFEKDKKEASSDNVTAETEVLTARTIVPPGVTPKAQVSDLPQSYLPVSTTSSPLSQVRSEETYKPLDRVNPLTVGKTDFAIDGSVTKAMDNFRTSSTPGKSINTVSTNRNFNSKVTDKSQRLIHATSPFDSQHRSSGDGQISSYQNPFQDGSILKLVSQQSLPSSRHPVNSPSIRDHRKFKAIAEEDDPISAMTTARVENTEKKQRISNRVDPSSLDIRSTTVESTEKKQRISNRVDPSSLDIRSTTVESTEKKQRISNRVDPSSLDIRSTTNDRISPYMTTSYVQETKRGYSYDTGTTTSTERAIKTTFGKETLSWPTTITPLNRAVDIRRNKGSITHQKAFSNTIKQKQSTNGISNEIPDNEVKLTTNSKSQSQNVDDEPHLLLEKNTPSLALSTIPNTADWVNSLKNRTTPEGGGAWLMSGSNTNGEHHETTEYDEENLPAPEDGQLMETSGTSVDKYDQVLLKVPPITVYRSLEAFGSSRSLNTDVSRTSHFPPSATDFDKNIVFTTTTTFVQPSIESNKISTQSVFNTSDLSFSSIFKQTQSVGNTIQEMMNSNRNKSSLASTTKPGTSNAQTLILNQSMTTAHTSDVDHRITDAATGQSSSDRAPYTLDHSTSPSTANQDLSSVSDLESKLVALESTNFPDSTKNCAGHTNQQLCEPIKLGNHELVYNETSQFKNLTVQYKSPNATNIDSGDQIASFKDQSTSLLAQAFPYLESFMKNITSNHISETFASASPEDIEMEKNLSVALFSANVSEILRDSHVNISKEAAQNEPGLIKNISRFGKTFSVHNNTESERDQRSSYSSILTSSQSGISFEDTSPSTAIDNHKVNLTNNQALTDLDDFMKISPLLLNITDESSLLSTLNNYLSVANSTDFGVEEEASTSDKTNVSEGDAELTTFFTSPVMERLKHSAQTLDYSLYGMGGDGKYVGEASVRSKSKLHTDSPSASRRVHTSALTKRTPNLDGVNGMLLDKQHNPLVTLPEDGFILHTHLSTGHEKDNEMLSTKGTNLVSSAPAYDGDHIPDIDNPDDNGLPALHIPHTALYIPGSEKPENSDETPVDSDADTEPESVPQPVERYGSPKPSLAEVGHVLTRHWPAVLGVTTGTVFLLTALITSIVCRQRRLLVQRSRWVDSPQHLNEPPAAVSEYGTCSATSLNSTDVTRSSANLV